MNRRGKNFTGNIVKDFSDNYFVDKLYSKKEEIKMLKKSKLSFYDEASEEEKALYLNYYKEMNPSFSIKYDTASIEEKELLLENAIEDATKNRDEFMSHYYKLVVKLANKYSKADFNDNSDLMQAGMIGLLNATRKFNLNEGTRFSTYATLLIKHFIILETKNRYAITFPANKHQDFIKMKKIAKEYAKSHSKDLKVEELATQAGICKGAACEYILYNTPVRSLNEMLEDEEFGNLIKDNKTSTEQEALRDILYNHLDISFENSLTQYEKVILISLYGLYDYNPVSLSVLEKRLGLKQNKIRAFEKSALKKLRKKMIAKEQKVKKR